MVLDNTDCRDEKIRAYKLKKLTQDDKLEIQADLRYAPKLSD